MERLQICDGDAADLPHQVAPIVETGKGETQE
jgi:hypothetical protein